MTALCGNSPGIIGSSCSLPSWEPPFRGDGLKPISQWYSVANLPTHFLKSTESWYCWVCLKGLLSPYIITSIITNDYNPPIPMDYYQYPHTSPRLPSGSGRKSMKIPYGRTNMIYILICPSLIHSTGDSRLFSLKSPWLSTCHTSLRVTSARFGSSSKRSTSMYSETSSGLTSMWTPTIHVRGQAPWILGASSEAGFSAKKVLISPSETVRVSGLCCFIDLYDILWFFMI